MVLRRQSWGVYGVAYCAFLCFSSSPLGIFARNHFLIMFMKYPEPQGRAGAAGDRLEPDSQRVPFFCQIRGGGGSDVSEDPDSVL